MGLTRRPAEIMALKALGWLVENEELLPVFLGTTGAGEADIREKAGDPDFLAAVLDFILMDDSWVIGCANGIGVPPEALPAARISLPGGDAVNWT